MGTSWELLVPQRGVCTSRQGSWWEPKGLGWRWNPILCQAVGPWKESLRQVARSDMHVRNFWKVGWKGARLGEGDQFGSRDSKPGKRQRKCEADSVVAAGGPAETHRGLGTNLGRFRTCLLWPLQATCSF